MPLTASTTLRTRTTTPARRGLIGLLASAALAVGLATAPPAASAEPAPLAAGVSIDVGGAGGEGGFVADRFGTGGLVDVKPASRPSLPNFSNTVANPIPESIWHTARYLESSYTVPGLTPGGSYELRLYFMDWYFTRNFQQRVFDVDVNGVRVLRDFDIIAAAIERGADGGAAFGVERDFAVVADQTGTVEIDFVRGKANQPQVNAIVLVPTP